MAKKATAQKKVRFIASRTVRDAGGEIDVQFVEGKTYDLPPASAERWVRRGVAEYVTTANTRTDTDDTTDD